MSNEQKQKLKDYRKEYFYLNKTPLGETGCLSNPDFFYLLVAQASSLLIHPLCQHSQLGYLWLPTPHCAAPV